MLCTLPPPLLSLSRHLNLLASLRISNVLFSFVCFSRYSHTHTHSHTWPKFSARANKHIKVALVMKQCHELLKVTSEAKNLTTLKGLVQRKTNVRNQLEQ